ncbi:MAG: DUF448 domain-containing protein [Actinobacteria bacterium]|uniref:Unannotated protein n=1 Tax=freshwater metagenome TaxID=449393 RepID=A0A6J7U8U9_9ZZZZ|nr:YlxR family protein [Actinomycetota bacterium]MSW47593.1 DUF448 domain-containing protein [Actinomycetota bacterium]MSX25109.1 DUF448 domain-containing protein [Actinomycetota bacterium]MSY46765.1 DUF448 domain-containing protein [Actinomycetota bacterium]MSY57264.1 DUF448 domain-containing protein [Actinomycetota bacterium]
MNPIRSCIGCRKRENPTMLLRVVCVEGKLFPDPRAIAPGRGAWVHQKCAGKAVEHGSFTRAYRCGAQCDGSELLHYINEMDAKDMKLK